MSRGWIMYGVVNNPSPTSTMKDFPPPVQILQVRSQQIYQIAIAKTDAPKCLK